MSKVISWIKNLRPRQVLTAFLVGLTVLVTQSFGYGNALQARADAQSPAGIYYQGTPESTDYKATPESNQSNNVIEQAKKNLQETAENIKEKLNLDEPLPKSTKEFLNLNKDRV